MVMYSLCVQEKATMHSIVILAMTVPMTWCMYNMKVWTGQATRDNNGKIVWTDPTFIGSDGQQYYEPEED